MFAGSLSAPVTLTTGDVDAATSAFTASPATIAADDTATSSLTFTAKDQQGNPVTGLGSSVTFLVQDSGGATVTSGMTVSAASETGTTGVYTATLKGTLAGSYTVVPQVSGSAVGSLSAPVTLTPGVLDSGLSTLAISEPSIPADASTTTTLTVTARDAFGNMITGIGGDLSFALTGSDGAAVDSAKIEVSAISEAGESGVYTATLKGSLGDTIKIDLVNNGVVTTLTTQATLVSITSLKDITVNGATFALDAGFPTTGFKKAKFTININNGSASDYNWTADASWVTIDNGIVTFTAGYGAPAQGKQVTLTATPKAGNATPLQYSFKLTSYFEAYAPPHSVPTLSEETATSYCGAQANVPLLLSYSNNGSAENDTTRKVGFLWNEWGSLNTYDSSAYPRESYFYARVNGGVTTNITKGNTVGRTVNTTAYIMCVKSY